MIPRLNHFSERIRIAAAGGHNLLMVEPIKPHRVRQTIAGGRQVLSNIRRATGLQPKSLNN
jgi:hypothetical protein